MSQPKVPQHVAIIMDGNGRWAAKRALPRIAGHRQGAEAVRGVVAGCLRLGISNLTLFAFSSENWRRPPKEVSLLMGLFRLMLEREVTRLHQRNIRLRVLGDRSAFAPKLQDLIAWGEELTKQNTALNLNIAANYGGRWDIVQAAVQMARDAVAGDLALADISEERFASHLALADLAEPDLFIRTGGEERVSNFMLWQLAYAEMYFTDVLWPDFDEDHLKRAIDSFARRQRRFGKTGEQVEAEECS